MNSPIEQFTTWLDEAARSGEPEPTAMALATTDAEGSPTVRMVLLKHADARGFVFYTNLGSHKAADLAANPKAELCFYWNRLGRQVRVTGRTERVTDAEADAYFASRPRLSQLGAWASKQSQPMDGYFDLEKGCAAFALRFGLGAVPRPPFWSGYRVMPQRIEFWQQKPFRRHERKLHTCTDGQWSEQWLYP
ncbi:MAG: pyridoxamine 5'-phosphate oxidase [Opitutaceae bacterium]|jgi:pyridoxamine 5'-phosphate oxidase